MENCIKAIKDGNAVKLSESEAKQLSEYIKKLEKQAQDGIIYRRSLTEETAKFAVLSVPSLSGESIEKVIAQRSMHVFITVDTRVRNGRCACS